MVGDERVECVVLRMALLLAAPFEHSLLGRCLLSLGSHYPWAGEDH